MIPDQTTTTTTDPATLLAALHATHAPAIRAYLGARTRDSAAVDDLTQDTFAKALTALPRMIERDRENSVAWRPWLFSIATNLLRDRGRFLSVRSGTAPLPESDELLPGGDSGDFAAHVDDQSALRGVLLSIDALPWSLRWVTRAALLRGMAYDAIGKRIRHRRTPQNNKSRVFRGRALLRAAQPYADQVASVGSWGAFLRSRRIAAHLSVNELAARAGVGEKEVWAYERGAHQNLAVMLRLIAITEQYVAPRCAHCDAPLRAPRAGAPVAERRFCNAPACQAARNRWKTRRNGGQQRTRQAQS